MARVTCRGVEVGFAHLVLVVFLSRGGDLLVVVGEVNRGDIRRKYAPRSSAHSQPWVLIPSH